MSEGMLRYRSEFPILEKTTYLISNSLGAMPRGVEDSLHQYTELWNTRGVRAWEDEWWMLALQVGDAIGSLFNAPLARWHACRTSPTARLRWLRASTSAAAATRSSTAI